MACGDDPITYFFSYRSQKPCRSDAALGIRLEYRNLLRRSHNRLHSLIGNCLSDTRRNKEDIAVFHLKVSLLSLEDMFEVKRDLLMSPGRLTNQLHLAERGFPVPAS